MPFSYTFIPVCSTISTVSEELLIDFHELVGEHSGENLAHVVCKFLSWSWFLYTNIDYLQIVAINVDNALNNDTMVEHLEVLLQHNFVVFSPSDVRMRCMAHMVHLAALEVL